MTPDELRSALDAAAPLDAVAAASLASRARAATLALPARAVELAAGAQGDRVAQARVLVGRLEELAAGALLDAAPADASTEVWMVAAASAAIVGLRSRVALRIQSMLTDRRLLPSGPADPRVEEPVRPRRVCDEAYLMLRELLNTGESRTAFVMDRWAFLRLPEPERDAEIARAAAGQPFARLLEDQEA
jgi:hypothetical protein